MIAPVLLHGMTGFAFSAALLSGQALASETLQPYQMVRSLQLVQDRIASGDHAALPMQAKILEMVDTRFRTADADTFKEPKNFRALLVYGMSGGNPVTVEATASRLDLEPDQKTIVSGIVDYLDGRPGAAIAALEKVDPAQLPIDLGAFVALVKGSLLADEKPQDALVLLDRARLLSPGTLVEEAALRRSVAIDAAQGDAVRFVLASTQYVERYLYSPYASQFADAFVSGVIAMHDAISNDKLIDITSMMDTEREKVIYLRIARRAAIDGLTELSAFASNRAEQGRSGVDKDDDPRAQLYASLSTITSATADDVRTKLEAIDRSRLSQGDQSLLDAAHAVVREMTTVPQAPSNPIKSVPAAAKPPVPEPAGAADSAVVQAGADSDLPPVEGVLDENADAQAPAAPPTEPPSDKIAKVAAPAADPAHAPDATDTAIADAQQKLESIDQILGDAPL